MTSQSLKLCFVCEQKQNWFVPRSHILVTVAVLMLIVGAIKLIANGGGIITICFGFLNLFLSYGLYGAFFARRGVGRRLPIMRERLYGPSGDKKPVIHQKLPPP